MKSLAILTLIFQLAAIVNFAFAQKISTHDWGKNEGVACPPYKPIHQEWMAALAVEKWDGGSHCGECVRVTADKGSMVLKIVDSCKTCQPLNDADLDLTAHAFKKLTGISNDVKPASWEFTSCDNLGEFESK